ncbi:hypothetical protein [Paracidovorax wautersii]|uniref:hypothetical protein n=1 Tax=Paracidovorax wautersii TaxID=1177982 RepID=UPI0031D3B267
MKALLPLLAAACLAGPATSWSADRACMIEGDVTIAGKTTAVKDCMEFTNDVPAEKLKAGCNGIAQMGAQTGGKPGKVTFLPRCPRPASGACKGLLGQPVDAYYYNQPAEALKEKREGCEASMGSVKGGTWSNGQ